MQRVLPHTRTERYSMRLRSSIGNFAWFLPLYGRVVSESDWSYSDLPSYIDRFEVFIPDRE